MAVELPDNVMVGKLDQLANGEANAHTLQIVKIGIHKVREAREDA